MSEKEQLVVDHTMGAAAEIAPWLWALEDARQRTKQALEGLEDAPIDWPSPDDGSSIGSLLYHIALVETDWLCVEVLEAPYPPELATYFPREARDARGALTRVSGERLADHLARLGAVRQSLLRVFQRMDTQDFRRPRQLARYAVTPEWVLHHLAQHEAEHRSQIAALRLRAVRARA